MTANFSSSISSSRLLLCLISLSHSSRAPSACISSGEYGTRCRSSFTCWIIASLVCCSFALSCSILVPSISKNRWCSVSLSNSAFNDSTLGGGEKSVEELEESDPDEEAVSD